MKQEIDNNAMWAAFRQELALQGELHVIAAIDNALNNLGFTIKETSTIIPIPLEQGEHSNFLSKIQVGDKVTRNQDGALVNLSQLNRVAKKPADKVKPKFEIEEGKYYVCTQTYTLRGKIVVIKGQTYKSNQYGAIEGEDGHLFIDKIDGKALNYFKPWIIQDAKAGDVLSDDYGIYIFEKFDECDKNCFVCIGAYQYSQKVYECEHMLCSTDTHPATKEQRDTLFAAMKEAGYKWDAEKKELKKIEDEDRKVLCDGCKEECKYNKSDDFTKALAECIHQAQGNVVDPMVLAETWKGELIKLAKSEEPVSVWHDAREEPEEGKDFAFVTYNGIMWARYRIEDIFIEWQNYRVQTDLDKWAYVSDLLKL